MTDTAASAPARNPARPIAMIVVVILILLTALYALSDRFAPASSRGQVTAHVIQIAPRVSGEVVEVTVADDSFVKAGTPMFRIDPRPLELAVAQAEANLATASQGVSASSASLVAAQAAVTRRDRPSAGHRVGRRARAISAARAGGVQVGSPRPEPAIGSSHVSGYSLCPRPHSRPGLRSAPGTASRPDCREPLHPVRRPGPHPYAAPGTVRTRSRNGQRRQGPGR